MVVAVKVPSVGESIVEGTIAQWLKKDGEAVRADEPLFELETEKATNTVPAPAAGTLKIAIPEGQTVPIGSVVGHIDPSAARDPKSERDMTAPATKRTADKANKPPAPAVLAPAVRRLVEEEGINPEDISGTGPGGRLTKEDVVNYLDQRQRSRAPAASTPPPSVPKTPAPVESAAGARETRQRMSAIRQRIADRLVASQKSTATLTTFNEADLSAIQALRTRFKEVFKQRHDVGLGFMGFFVKACVEALRAYSILNSRIEGQDVVTYHDYNIGVAVSTDKGLMVPVIRGADRLSFAMIEKTLADLAGRAREGKISVADLQGGTFTITNGGVFGSLLSTPILSPPQSAILGMHAVQKRPVVVDDQVVVRPMMYLALSYDHRLIDGREAVLFLIRVKECLESPERLLLEI
jgi:2-oxoglutarate dehydrogenase E2 component (dihydrolipoamide succinyltransferase)